MMFSGFLDSLGLVSWVLQGGIAYGLLGFSVYVLMHFYYSASWTVVSLFSLEVYSFNHWAQPGYRFLLHRLRNSLLTYFLSFGVYWLLLLCVQAFWVVIYSFIHSFIHVKVSVSCCFLFLHIDLKWVEYLSASCFFLCFHLKNLVSLPFSDTKLEGVCRKRL